MPFLSIEFIAFFLLFFPLYWWLQPAPSLQNKLLIVVSLSWLAFMNILFVLVVVGFSLMIALVSTRMQRAVCSVNKRRWLVVGVVLAVLNLIVFKYFDDWRALIQHTWQAPILDLLLPLGISYYTFQGIAYLVALYREQCSQRKTPFSCQMNALDLLLHFSFFPTITAGPIARAAPSHYFQGQHIGMALQITTSKRRVVLRPALALALVLLGVAKVWWFASAINIHWVVPVFDNPLQYDRATLLLAIYGYTLELYFNFSGYTDLVIGIAMLLGFQLPPNFDQPLRAINIRDFWHRWHMSLSTWIRDYIYIPLGGSRCGFWQTQGHVMIAMVLSGVWHGNGWPFLLWGAIHGVALVALNIGEAISGHRALFGHSLIARGFSVLLTLSFVAFAFVFFRAERLDDAWMMFEALCYSNEVLNPWALLALSMLLMLLCGYGLLVRVFIGFVALVDRTPYWLWPLILGTVLMVVVVCAPSGIPGFIYAAF